MLMRNVDVVSGLCNGTLLIILGLGQTVTHAQVLNGPHAGKHVYIPLMNLSSSDSNVAITF